MRAKHFIPYACCCICYSIKFDMQHDLVLKKLNFDVLTPRVRLGRWVEGLQAKYLFPCCCICDSFEFDIQHDHVLKKLNLDHLTPPLVPVSGVGGGLCTKLYSRYQVAAL